MRSKAPAMPVSGETTPQQELAQDLALSDPQVQGYTVGKRSAVMSIKSVGMHFPQGASACQDSDCRQIEIYNFDENATVTALVDLASRQVLEVVYQPGAQPGLNKHYQDLAADIIRFSPEVIQELGRQPDRGEIYLIGSGLQGTLCDGHHYCVSAAFHQQDWFFWAVVDLTEERLAGTAWTPARPDDETSFIPFVTEGCPSPGTVNRGGWTMGYEATSSDGLRAYDVAYQGMTVLTSVKVLQWNTDYGTTGFQDPTGCGGEIATIAPYGDTQILTLANEMGEEVGFELVQDFRQKNWGVYCNYRYDQRLQFYLDGRFRVVSGAYGKGCSTVSIYRPLVRMDVAIAGDENDNFALWDGSRWIKQTNEVYRVPYSDPGNGPHAVTADGNSWLVFDQSGVGYTMEMGQGQFGDLGRGDYPFVYVTSHKKSEGDLDMGTIGTCCNDDHRQGPEQYVDGGRLENENIVVWYVPQMVTDGVDGENGFYCWTVQGEPNPETYPCFSGPMFHPVAVPSANFTHNGPIALGESVVFTNTSVGVDLSYFWDFGDGIGTSTAANPTYQYEATGLYPVTLTVSSPEKVATFTDNVWVGVPPRASFTHSAPTTLGETTFFTSTSSGDPPPTLEWDFGDGVGFSTQENPSYTYPTTGTFTVTLTVTNPVQSDAATETIQIFDLIRPDFTISQGGNINLGHTVHFINLSAGGQSYRWDFGDGTGTSSKKNPIYTYQQAGTYLVRLTAINPIEGKIVEKEIEVLDSIDLFLPQIFR